MNDVFGDLGEDARVLKVSHILPEGPLAHDTAYRALCNIETYLSKCSVSRETLANGLGMTGVDAKAIGRLLAGKDQIPKTKRDEVVRAANAWIEEDFRRRMQSEAPGGFVRTAIHTSISGIGRNVRAGRMIGVLVGPAGLGKTTCIRQLAYELPGTVVVTIDRDSQSGSGLLRALLNAVQKKRRGWSRVMLSQVVERLGGSGRLLIIDQAHELSDSGLKVIMQLHDAADLPILMVGTVALNRRLLDDEDPEFGQISSRVGMRLDLRTVVNSREGGRAKQWISAAELRKMFSGCKLRLHPDATRMIARIANYGVGHLRRVKHVLRLAEAIAGRDKGCEAHEITVAHVEAAYKLVVGEGETLAALWVAGPATKRAVSA